MYSTKSWKRQSRERWLQPYIHCRLWLNTRDPFIDITATFRSNIPATLPAEHIRLPCGHAYPLFRMWMSLHMGLPFEYIQYSNTIKNPDHQELWLVPTWHIIELEDESLLLCVLRGTPFTRTRLWTSVKRVQETQVINYIITSIMLRQFRMFILT